MLAEVIRSDQVTRAALQVMRTSPGGPDNGQTYRVFQGKGALAAGGLTVQLGTVPAGKTWFVCDLGFDLATSTCDISVQAGGVPVWLRFLQTGVGISEVGRTCPPPIGAGQAVTVVFGAPATGTPNGYWNVGIVEQ